jgi:hypothetical protein
MQDLLQRELNKISSLWQEGSQAKKAPLRLSLIFFLSYNGPYVNLPYQTARFNFSLTEEEQS